MSPSAAGLLAAAPEDEEFDTDSASAEGTADDVAGDSGVGWDAEGKSKLDDSDGAESEPADSAADMPSWPLGFHIKAPTYA